MNKYNKNYIHNEKIFVIIFLLPIWYIQIHTQPRQWSESCQKHIREAKRRRRSVDSFVGAKQSLAAWCRSGCVKLGRPSKICGAACLNCVVCETIFGVDWAVERRRTMAIQRQAPLQINCFTRRVEMVDTDGECFCVGRNIVRSRPVLRTICIGGWHTQ